MPGGKFYRARCLCCPSKYSTRLAKGLGGASMESHRTPEAQQHLETGRASKKAAGRSGETGLNSPQVQG